MSIDQIRTPNIDTGESNLEFGSIDGSILARQLVPEDANTLFTLISANKEHLSSSWFIDGKTPPESPREVANKLQHPPMPAILCFGIFEHHSLVGRLDVIPRKNGTPTLRPDQAIEAEFSYFVGEQFNGRGIASQALNVVMNGMNERFGIHTFTSEVLKGTKFTEASARTLHKSGFLQAISPDELYLRFINELSKE